MNQAVSVRRVGANEAAACVEALADVLVRHPEIDHRDERYLNHRFPYAIDPAIVPSHRPRLRSVDDLDDERVGGPRAT